MPNFSQSLSPSDSLALDLLIFNEIYYYIECRKIQKKRNSLKYDVKTNSGSFFQFTWLFPYSQ